MRTIFSFIRVTYIHFPDEIFSSRNKFSQNKWKIIMKLFYSLNKSKCIYTRKFIRDNYLGAFRNINYENSYNALQWFKKYKKYFYILSLMSRIFWNF